jgi:putative effector of murein hydrolase LrgA (UPF0299 family)
LTAFASVMLVEEMVIFFIPWYVFLLKMIDFVGEKVSE